MSRSDFAGSVAKHYLAYRRDLPGGLAARIGAAFDLGPRDVICDLGCGTGQLCAPLARHARTVIAVDPEPDMLQGLRERRLDGVVPVQGRDADLARLAERFGPFAAVTVGNALHWMDEPTVVAASRAAVRPGGGVAIVTQGPPMWLADTDWGRALRAVLEAKLGTRPATCGTDQRTLDARTALVRARFDRVELVTQDDAYPVDADWVVGHLRSAMSPTQEPAGLEQAIRQVLAPFGPLVEPVRTTVLLGITGRRCP